ncbi:MAG: hypothetical protein GXP16_19505 [Gammaproteobacteria bacterium]|nr:hypothetical protein [Gammaproteobacteria bacterium]
MHDAFKRLATATTMAFCISTAIADQGGVPEPGTVFIFTEGRVERFVRTEGDVHVWATPRGREYIRSANPAEPILQWEIGGKKGERTVTGSAAALWPPQPGNSARFRVLTKLTSEGRQRRSVALWSCRIGEQTKVSVSTRTYGAMPITCLRYSAHTMRPLQKRTWWWSEDVGHYVRRRYENLRNGETIDINLCAALPEHRASAVRIASIVNQDC